MLELNIQARWPSANSAAGFQRRTNHHPNLERLICAAVSNARLGALLVQSPAAAIAQSEVGRQLSSRERRLVLAIVDAEDIYDFAGRLHASLLEMRSAPAEAQITEVNETPIGEKSALRRPSLRAPRHELHMAERIPTNIRNKPRHRTV